MISRPVAPLTYAARYALVEQMAPRYRQARLSQKMLLLDTFVDLTGYTRKYAIHLLNHVQEGKQMILRPRLPHYGPQVQQALFLAWKATNYICAKRLVPFLPTLVEALERHGHLHLTEESHDHLLSMSVTTAERLLRTQRKPAPRGLSTTKAGSLLKQQIPIRTFQEWNEAQPGFLEADLVAHCGGHTEGNFLYTLTLTDVATGWTECLPLLFRSPEAVQATLHRARTLFPFPILGIDTDNGGEFIYAELLAYCEREQITFTRGRPEVKNDQCFVEQKNGAIVRQFVGHDRLTGELAYRQLRELYRALRLYVNFFQLSMKLQSKDHDGDNVRRVYDAAKTPLQRLLLSGIVSAPQLHEAAQALDPIRLLHHLQELQQALWRCASSASLSPQSTPAASPCCSLPHAASLYRCKPQLPSHRSQPQFRSPCSPPGATRCSAALTSWTGHERHETHSRECGNTFSRSCLLIPNSVVAISSRR